MPIDPRSLPSCRIERLPRKHRSVTWRSREGLSFEIGMAAWPPLDHVQRPDASAADPQEPPVERVQVHERGRRHDDGRTGAGGRAADPLRRPGHRDRNPGREAQADLRGLPAGGRHDQPPLRRDGARADHQPRDGASARRRDRRDERPGAGEHVHLVGPVAIRGRRRRRRHAQERVPPRARAGAWPSCPPTRASPARKSCSSTTTGATPSPSRASSEGARSRSSTPRTGEPLSSSWGSTRTSTPVLSTR